MKRTPLLPLSLSLLGIVLQAFGAEAVSAETPAPLGAPTPPTVPSFKQEVLPILTKAGCNSGGCHGKGAGQNGFRLSLRGFAPAWDHAWITTDLNGRRVNYSFPERSLLVEKAAGTVAHEGGRRFKPGSRECQTLVDWIAARAPGPLADEADAASLEIHGGGVNLKPGESRKLTALARYPDGTTRDVTWLAQFFANDESLVSVKPDGTVRALRSGEGVVRVHFQSLVSVARFVMPAERELGRADFTSTWSAVDAPVFSKLAELRIPPSPAADERTFVRRAYLDTIGTLPTNAEVEAYLADTDADKRGKLATALLERPEWADYWTLQLADVLQNRQERDHDVRGVKGVRAFHGWLRGQLEARKSWADIARAVLLASGDVLTHPEIGYFTTVVGEFKRVEESELPDSVAQSFLGTRIGCARCHNHPLERYTQDDFYHFAAFFGRVSLERKAPETGATVLALLTVEERAAAKNLEDERRKLAALEASGTEPQAKPLLEQQKRVAEAEKRLAGEQAKTPAAMQPRTKTRLAPRALDRSEPVLGADAREALVSWMLASEQFSGAMVNRIWKHFFGTGLVEPVDDLRASNPPSNEALWNLLNAEFRHTRFDLRALMRLILTSRAYALSSSTLPDNAADTRYYSHYLARRLPAEVFADALADATNTPTLYEGYPLGIRALQLPDPKAGSYFLSLFGRSERVTACACERRGEVTLPQLLHLRNGDELQQSISAPGGRLAELLKNKPDREAADALFAATLQRRANNNEFAAIRAQLDAAGAEQRNAVFADLFWTLLNSKEFAFNH